MVPHMGQSGSVPMGPTYDCSIGVLLELKPPPTSASGLQHLYSYNILIKALDASQRSKDQDSEMCILEHRRKEQ